LRLATLHRSPLLRSDYNTAISPPIENISAPFILLPHKDFPMILACLYGSVSGHPNDLILAAVVSIF
jgi:hypothetical protein